MTRSVEQELSGLGVEARQVLENPAFIEAMRLMREDAYATFKKTSIRDKEGLILCAQVGRLIDAVETTLRGILEAGKLAQAKVDINAARNESRTRRVLRQVSGN